MADGASVAVMSLNATKAGMDGLDKASINAKIDELSRGSKFYEAKARAQHRIDEKIDVMREKMRNATVNVISPCEQKADCILESLESRRDVSKVIVHVDMDAFYAAVEEKDDPSLSAKPMAVGGSSMLSTSNYLARRFGVRAGMPGFIGKKLCPDLVIVAPNFDKYRRESAEIRRVFARYDPMFCPMSLDEAYLDLSDFLAANPGLKPEAAVAEMRAEIRRKTGLTASAGIARNALLAKVGSDRNKPDGQFSLLDEAEARNLVETLPVRKVGGIGNVTEQMLKALGVDTCGDIIAKRGLVVHMFSESTANYFLQVGLGIGSTNVAEMSNRERKSMSNETTFRDTSDPENLAKICDDLAEELSNEMAGENVRGRQLTVKIKTDKFSVKTRVANLATLTSDAEVMKKAARKVLAYFIENAEDKPLTLRLMGLRMSQFDEFSSGGNQPTLDKFMNGRRPHRLAFDCPICGEKVESISEQSFNASHLDKCLERSDGGCENLLLGRRPKTATLTSSSDDGSCSRECVADKRDKIRCPICSVEISSRPETVNRHVDECLNSQTIRELTRIDNPDKGRATYKRPGEANDHNFCRTKKKKIANTILTYLKK